MANYSKYDKNGNLNIQNSTLGDYLKSIFAKNNTPTNSEADVVAGVAPAVKTEKEATITDKIADELGNVGTYEYDTGKGGVYGAYASAVDQQNNLLKQQQELMERQRRRAMEATVNANNQAADNSLKEAYIANMLAKRNLPQQLKAVGVSGGASETTLADIQNTYMNNRFGIEANRNDANRQARLAYDNGVLGDYSDYLAKEFELKKGLADKAVASADSTKEAEKLTGYKLGNITAKDEVDLYKQLIKLYGQEAAEQYLLNQGIIKLTTGTPKR